MAINAAQNDLMWLRLLLIF